MPWVKALTRLPEVRATRAAEPCVVHAHPQMHQARYMVAARSRDKSPQTRSLPGRRVAFFVSQGDSSMNARARHTPQIRESATDSGRTVGGSSVAVGACLCGTVHYAVDRPLETLSHYSDPVGAAQGGMEWAALVSAPLAALRW